MNTIVVKFPFKVSDNHNISSDNDSLNWSLVNIPVSHFKSYEVYACKINSEIYIKPSKIYFNKEFEDIFNFGINCNNYDENKIVWVKNAYIK